MQPQDQQTELATTQHNYQPQFITPNALFTPEQEAAYNADVLALSEQTTQQLPAIDKKQHSSLRAVILIALALAGTLFFIWRPATAPAPAPAITQQSFSSTVSTGSAGNTGSTIKNTASTSSGPITVYILGEVKNPGIYSMAAGARVYELLQVAGGPLADADLVTLNLAAKLSDGQEVYVAKRSGSSTTSATGENLAGATSASSGSTALAGGPVNINTASVAELEQQLHVAHSTAQNIVNYRTQNGAYTSIDQLLHVVRKTTYDKIKGMVTV